MSCSSFLCSTSSGRWQQSALGEVSPPLAPSRRQARPPSRALRPRASPPSGFVPSLPRATAQVEHLAGAAWHAAATSFAPCSNLLEDHCNFGACGHQKASSASPKPRSPGWGWTAVGGGFPGEGRCWVPACLLLADKEHFTCSATRDWEM